MTLKLENNNIKCVDTKGTTYYTHLHWLKKFLPMLEAECKEVKVRVKGIFDKEDKGEVTVLEIKQKEYNANFFDTIVELLEEGQILTFKDWTFELVKFNKPLTK